MTNLAVLTLLTGYMSDDVGPCLFSCLTDGHRLQGSVVVADTDSNFSIRDVRLAQ
jgi:hypothetical protein